MSRKKTRKAHRRAKREARWVRRELGIPQTSNLGKIFSVGLNPSVRLQLAEPDPNPGSESVPE